jgi:hypothetical protein
MTYPHNNHGLFSRSRQDRCSGDAEAHESLREYCEWANHPHPASKRIFEYLVSSGADKGIGIFMNNSGSWIIDESRLLRQQGCSS